MQSIQAEIEANNEKERHYVTHSADEIGLDIALRMSKTKLSFDLIRATAWQRRLIDGCPETRASVSNDNVHEDLLEKQHRQRASPLNLQKAS